MILLLHLTKDLFGSGNIIILDSRFCLIKSIIVLNKCGFYASYSIKKIIYYHKVINGEAIKLYISDKEVVAKSHLSREMDCIGFEVFPWNNLTIQ